MSQQTNPIALRLRINNKYASSWYADNNKEYANYVASDYQIREHISRSSKNARISKIEISRVGSKVIVNIDCNRPGIMIGKNGSEIEKLRNSLLKTCKLDNVTININEITGADAMQMCYVLASDIEARRQVKRSMQKLVDLNKKNVLGIKIKCSGRINGAEIARSEQINVGKLPLNTFRANIGYAMHQVITKYGTIGIKIWVNKGEKKHEQN